MGGSKRSFQVVSPYRDISGTHRFRGMWHCHMHSDFPSPAQAEKIARAGGYHFLGVTDHDNRYRNLPWSPDDWRRAGQDGFLVIRGFEATHPMGHITCLGLAPGQVGIDTGAAWKNRYEQENLDAGYGGFPARAAAAGAFLALNHPHRWRGEGRRLVGEPGFEFIHALEIYNGKQAGQEASRGCTEDLLDECLGAGARLWAAANPDCHSWDASLADGPFNGYSVVFAPELSPAAILEALKAGRFFASTGLEPETISVDESGLAVAAPGCRTITFYGAGGVRLAEEKGEAAVYRFRGEEGYVRAELEAGGETVPGGSGLPRKAWLQPVRLEPPE